MLREDGMVFDDGTVAARRAALLHDHHHGPGRRSSSVESSIAARCCGRELDVELVDVTDQWAAIALAGPRRARPGELIDIDVTDKALPFMSLRDAAHIGHAEVRLFRISFSGDLAYEIYVPAGRGAELWQALSQRAPARHHALWARCHERARIEKGHVTGAELNGRVRRPTISASDAC